MKIATFNINGVNGHLPVLLRWLDEQQPDVACLQEIRAPDEKFPDAAIAQAGYGAIWHGQPRWNGVAILARGTQPQETRRGLPGDPDDSHSRYIEAAVDDVVVGCLYLPNGNPWPGPKFDYKFRWFRRLDDYAAELLASGRPAVLAGDYNVVPTDLDACIPQRWIHDAVFQPQAKQAYADLLRQGWTDALRHLHPRAPIFTYWDFVYGRPDWKSGLRMDHLLVSPPLVPKLKAGGVDRDVRAWEKTSDHAPAWIVLD
jgi:exodeoxyribonuclease-3